MASPVLTALWNPCQPFAFNPSPTLYAVDLYETEATVSYQADSFVSASGGNRWEVGRGIWQCLEAASGITVVTEGVLMAVIVIAAVVLALAKLLKQ